MLFWKLVKTSLRSQMQYPISFVMLTGAYFLGTFFDLFGLYVLFDRFRLIQGWTLYELGLIYGIVHMGFALAEGFARGFDSFGLVLKQGDFDRLLLRPLSPLFQVAFSDIQGIRLGRFLQGFVILITCSFKLSISLFSTLLICFSVLSACALFCGLFIIQATLCFWTVEPLEIMNIFTYGGVQAGQYPMSIYVPSFRNVFTFFIPLACVAYYPIATLLGHEAPPFGIGYLAPLTGFAFLLGACQFWHFGVRHYRSTGN